MSKIPVKINEYMLASGELTAIFHGKRILTKGEKPDQVTWLFSFVLILILVRFWGIFFQNR